MIDFFVIFTKTGLVLFTHHVTGTLKGDPVTAFIKEMLLEGRSGDKSFTYNEYGIRWQLANNLGLVFAAVFHKLLIPVYLDDLLGRVSNTFVEAYGNQIKSTTGILDFEDDFTAILQELEKSHSRRPNLSLHSSGMMTRSKAKDIQTSNNSGKKQGKKKAEKSKKEKRNWNGKQKLSEDAAKELNKFSGDTSKIANDAPTGGEFMPENENEKVEFENESEEEEEVESWSSKFTSFFEKVSGKKPLDHDDLAIGLEKMKKHLVTKNVASDVADQLINDVEGSLLGKKLNSFTKGSSHAISSTLHDSLKRILTPKKSIDILRAVSTHKSDLKAKMPFTVVLLGVNGVGKSTSLSKVCYYLKSNGLKVLICACDTFRSGAVEQLKVHAKNLNVELFESGYGKDPASVAMSGRRYAKDNGFDVVLVDTAGRMQNNVPLMREIAKLVTVNQPDLTLFVGEAIVGNDGINQLTEFNKFLTPGRAGRGIDGMILTKFDTIDDKVGAAVSMVHKSGQPIYFVGTGQKYTNLNKLNVDKVLKSLLN